jgi:predicted Rossmann fold nucleotide-binding protein DprA/Smf involved in DNA uptake
MRHARRDLERPAIRPERVQVAAPKQQGKRLNEVSAPPARSKPGPPAASQNGLPDDLPSPQLRVLELLAEGPQHIDLLGKASGLPLGELFAALTILEIQGFVRQTPGKIYETAERVACQI